MEDHTEKKDMEVGVQLGGWCDSPRKRHSLFNSQEEEEVMRHF